MSEKAKDRKFKCYKCEKSYKEHKHLVRHLADVHHVDKPYKCTYNACEETFAKDKERRQHIATIHRDEEIEKILSGAKDKSGQPIITTDYANNYLSSAYFTAPEPSSRVAKDFARICDLVNEENRDYINFIVKMDPLYGIPVAVYESLRLEDMDSLGVSFSRDNIKDFHIDSTYDGNQAKHHHYTKSGFHRGHMAAYKNHAGDIDGAVRTTLFTNVVPVFPAVNAGPMSAVENKVRDLLREHKRALVISLALFEEGRPVTFLKEVIGVPHLIGKLIIFQNEGTPRVIAYAIPNTPTVQNLQECKLDDPLELIKRTNIKITLPISTKQMASPRYAVEIPKYSLDTKDINAKEIKRRYPYLFIPSDFCMAKSTWMDTFPLHSPFELGRPCPVQIMRKGVQKIEIPNSDGFADKFKDIPDVLEPSDASFNFKAKVMIPSMYTLEAIIKKASGVGGGSGEGPDTPQHVDRLINFIVGMKTSKHEVMALGGPWSPSLDGLNPHSDPQTLINTAIRCARALAGVNLSRCKHWYRFMELYYKRSNCLETVVFFLPDVWSCLPKEKEWTKLKSLHKYAVYGETSDLMGKDSGGADAGSEDRLSQTVSAASTPTANCDGISKDSAETQSGKLDISGLPPPKAFNPKALNVVQLRTQLNLRNLKFRISETEPNSANAESVTDQVKEEIDKPEVQSLEKNLLVNETKEEVDEEQCIRLVNPSLIFENQEDDDDVSMEDGELKEDPDAKACQQLQKFNQVFSMFPQDTFPVIKPGMKEEEIKMWESRYALPKNSTLLVYPSSTAKGENFDCISMSLGLLRDYRIIDKNEDSFEVSLFSEFFHEMLLRDFAFRIYREMATECVKTNADEVLATEKESEKDEKSNKQKNAAEPATKRRKLSTTSTVTTTTGKKTSDPYLLLSFTFFDVTRCGYITETDLEDLCCCIGIGLTQAQIRKVVSKVVHKGTLYYRKWTEKLEKDKTKPDDNEIRILAQGNMAHFPVFMLQDETNSNAVKKSKSSQESTVPSKEKESSNTMASSA